MTLARLRVTPRLLHAWLALAPCLAAAQGAIDPPRYEASILCYRRASVADGFSEEAMAQCMSQQRRAFDWIRRRWNELPEEVQTGCDERTRASQVLDYESLRSCIDTQLRRIAPQAPLAREPEPRPRQQ